ncbi:MAG: polyphosphate:AMP phosphotransferase [Methylococcales bacterium]|nr:polyphosphate:AMP phosphotransferase [Methylococcales bacterium]
MFEVAELTHQISDQDYAEPIVALRTELLMVQQQLKTLDFPVLILISGVDGGGKGELIHALNEWLDARYMHTEAFDQPSDEEQERPKFWRFIRALPPKGQIGIFVGSWYSEPISKRVSGHLKDGAFERALNDINALEKLLTDDGGLIIKCWLHLKKSIQKKRLKALAANPDTQWQVTHKDAHHIKHYDDFIDTAEAVLTRTSTVHSPWLIVDGSDGNYARLTVGQHILNRIHRHIQQRARQQTLPEAAEPDLNLYQQSLLDALDLSLSLKKSDYQDKLAFYQTQLGQLSRKAKARQHSILLVFEGWDAAGKGGAIRRLTYAMDPRLYRVIPIAAPTDEERAQHYLWRFWRHLPRAGKMTIYDRSWYGRVLVERVEKLASNEEWQRAYAEIVDFERALTDHGITILKFWLHIDKDEQLKRFQAREKIPYKQFKITDEDYRNRDKWDDYKAAVNEMIARTSTHSAPWIMVEGNDKRHARIKVLETVCAALTRQLG